MQDCTRSCFLRDLSTDAVPPIYLLDKMDLLTVHQWNSDSEWNILLYTTQIFQQCIVHYTLRGKKGAIQNLKGFFGCPHRRTIWRTLFGSSVCTTEEFLHKLSETVPRKLICVLIVLTRVLTWLQFGVITDLWADARLRWPLASWRSVHFTDESQFQLYRADSRQRVWCSVVEWFADVNVVNRVPHGCGRVMVWAGISYGQRTQLHFIDVNLNAQKYHDEILMPIVRPCSISIY